VITIVAVLVFLCHCFDFQRIYEKVKQALLNFKDIAANVVAVVLLLLSWLMSLLMLLQQIMVLL
jgi:hypothetical protein